MDREHEDGVGAGRFTVLFSDKPQLLPYHFISSCHPSLQPLRSPSSSFPFLTHSDQSVTITALYSSPTHPPIPENAPPDALHLPLQQAQAPPPPLGPS